MHPAKCLPTVGHGAQYDEASVSPGSANISSLCALGTCELAVVNISVEPPPVLDGSEPPCNTAACMAARYMMPRPPLICLELRRCQ
mmetsp:Transcript_6739/g.14682  ORF Transcript_6739/g.14682 Transcript_6739/m.14682 type:complete len:86 (+) Transcript_6739:196-453(+)